MMDLRHMRHFVAVAEERHFGRAAQRLNMAQPPLSQSIQRLEQNLGVPLFDRTHRGVELTPAGQVLLQEARRTLMQAELARKLTLRAAEEAPEIRVSFIGPALYRMLPSVLVRLRGVAPELNVRLFERSSPDQVNGLLSGDYDVGFVTAGTELLDGCDSLVVERAPFVAAIPAAWPIARQAFVTLAELAAQPFILPPRKYALQTSDVLSMFKTIGEMPRVAQEATQTNTTLSLVGAGLGCSIVAATTVLFQPRNVALVPIADPQAYRRWEMLMVWAPEQMSATARLFVDEARAELAANPHWLDATHTP